MQTMRRNRSSSPSRPDSSPVPTSETVPTGVSVVQVDASEDVWGELERLLYGPESERTPPESPLVDALRDSSSLGAPLVRSDSSHRDAAGEEGSIISPDVVPELKLEKGAFCLMSSGGDEEMKPAQTGEEDAKIDNKGRNKRRGFIILDTEAASPSRHERRESITVSDPEALDMIFKEAKVAAGRAKDEQLSTELPKAGTQALDAAIGGAELMSETLPRTPDGAKDGHWDNCGASMDPSMDDRASVASTAEVLDPSGPASQEAGALMCAATAGPALTSPGSGAHEDSVQKPAVQADAARNNASWHSLSAARRSTELVGSAQVAAHRSESAPVAPNSGSRKSLDLRRPRKFDVSDVETSSEAEAGVREPEAHLTSSGASEKDAAKADESPLKKEIEDKTKTYLDANPDAIDDMEQLREAGVDTASAIAIEHVT